MCKKLLHSMFKQLGNEAWARLKPHRDGCGLDWCWSRARERGMCRERDRRDVLDVCRERDRRDVLDARQERESSETWERQPAQSQRG